jgi:hypothetical protein
MIIFKILLFAPFINLVRANSSGWNWVENILRNAIPFHSLTFLVIIGGLHFCRLILTFEIKTRCSDIEYCRSMIFEVVGTVRRVYIDIGISAKSIQSIRSRDYYMVNWVNALYFYFDQIIYPLLCERLICWMFFFQIQICVVVHI